MTYWDIIPVRSLTATLRLPDTPCPAQDEARQTLTALCVGEGAALWGVRGGAGGWAPAD